MSAEEHTPEVKRMLDRRRLIMGAGAGTVFTALAGGLYAISRDEVTRQAAAVRLADGRPRLPPGQRVIERLRPMGGQPGDPSPSRFRLRVHGEVERPFELSFAELLEQLAVEQTCDVHCVTGWSVLDCRWVGVRVAELARRAGVRETARHVIFEAAHGYTTNVPLEEALLPTSLVAYRLDGEPLAQPHGSPVRGLVPHLYFWKSAKWLTGIRFQREDEPGFWEVRGYHNHADPWLEERYA